MSYPVIDIRDGSKQSVGIDSPPDLCPLCGNGMEPEFINGFLNKKNAPIMLQMIFRCTFRSCWRIFISYYSIEDATSDYYVFESSLPMRLKEKKFSDSIKTISSDFFDIYNEAFKAEQNRLTQICGPGYRKALEFLIKDYLIQQNPSKKDEIELKSLGKCILEDINNQNLKKVAERATWLGNDEVHYKRKWEEKDISHFKELIDLTVHWIEMEESTKHVLEDMPNS